MLVNSNQGTWTITAGPHGAMIYLQTDSLRGGAILDNPDARKTLATKGLRTDVSLQDWNEIDKAVRAALGDEGFIVKSLRELRGTDEESGE